MIKASNFILSCVLCVTALSSCQKESASPSSVSGDGNSSGSSGERTIDVVETRPAILKAVTFNVSANIHGFYQALPARYDSTTKRYPLLVFLHGQGELGNGTTDLTKVLKNGTANLIKNGKFPANFVVNTKNYSFIVVMPQLSKWPVADDVQGMINYAVKKYRVDTTRIYVTGLSMGGGGTWVYASKHASRIAAIVPVSGAAKLTDLAAKAIASTNLPVWAFHNDGDPTVPVIYSKNNISKINSNIPTPKAKLTLWTVRQHDAWTKAMDPAYKENNLNMYQWMLQYTR
jgi:predicted peptidase